MQIKFLWDNLKGRVPWETSRRLEDNIMVLVKYGVKMRAELKRLRIKVL